MGFESIQNYNEHLVSERIHKTLEPTLDQFNDELLDDVACIALNKLPPRYVCHSVDFLSHLSAQDLQQILRAVDEAILHAADVVINRRREDDR